MCKRHTNDDMHSIEIKLIINDCNAYADLGLAWALWLNSAVEPALGQAGCWTEPGTTEYRQCWGARLWVPGSAKLGALPRGREMKIDI